MEQNSSTTRQLTDSKQNIVLRQGSYGNGKQNFSRTFSFFKDLISSQFCIKQREKKCIFSASSVEIKRRTRFL